MGVRLYRVSVTERFHAIISIILSACTECLFKHCPGRIYYPTLENSVVTQWVDFQHSCTRNGWIFMACFRTYESSFWHITLNINPVFISIVTDYFCFSMACQPPCGCLSVRTSWYKFCSPKMCMGLGNITYERVPLLGMPFQGNGYHRDIGSSPYHYVIAVAPGS